jgi:hypothetical protein
MRSVRHRHDDALSQVSWGAFENLVADHFRAQGYRVEHVRPPGDHAHHDSGIDLKLFRDQEIIAVQCKHWNSFQVPHHDVHQLIRVMPIASATGAIVITSGEFTAEAIEAAAKFRHVRLIDGKTIRAMLGPIEATLEKQAPQAETWIPIRSEPPPAKHATNRAAAIAAVAAVVVMGVALVTLYTVYIHEIQRAQMSAMTQAKKANEPQRTTATAVPSLLPGLAANQKPIGTRQERPPVIHGAPTQRNIIAEWNDKQPIQASLKDQ